MKMMILNHSAVVLAAILLGSSTAGPALAGDDWTEAVEALASDDGPNVAVAAGADTDGPPKPAPAPGQQQLSFRPVSSDDDRPTSKEMTWLGVGVSESPEPLSAQLGLKPGEGLVVNYIATNSPAAEAGLQRNDLLVELDGQMLVDSIQLRKLVQMHAAGDSIKIEFYRAGKKQSATAKLSLRPFNQAFMDGGSPPYDFGNHKFFFAPKLPPQPALEKDKLDIQVKQATEQVRRAMEQAQLDKDKLAIQVKQATEQAQQAMEQAQRAVQEALRQEQNERTDANRKLWTIRKKLGNYAEGGVSLGKDATVIVKNEGESVRTIVKKDDSGTYVIVADPAKHLTAHDPNGKLLFDGLVESSEQQQKVPPEVWTKVKPMLKQLDRPSPAAKRLSQDNPEEE